MKNDRYQKKQTDDLRMVSSLCGPHTNTLSKKGKPRQRERLRPRNRREAKEREKTRRLFL